jgi:hypothetical protein
VVLPQTTLGQISIVPRQTDPHPRKKEEKKLNNKQQQKRQIAKRAGCPECRRGVRGNPSQQVGWRRQERQHMPSNQERESL